MSQKVVKYLLEDVEKVNEELKLGYRIVTHGKCLIFSGFSGHREGIFFVLEKE